MAVLSAGLSTAACVESSFADGQFLCDPTGESEQCPGGLTCAADGRCRSDATVAAATGGAGAAGTGVGPGVGPGPGSGTTGSAGGACVPATCELDHVGACGAFDDGCGSMLACDCIAPLACIGGACICEGTQTRSPNAATNDVFTGAAAWLNANNVRVDDAMSADVGGLADGSDTQRLYAFDYGFAVPDGAVIVGYTARIKRRKGNTGNIRDLALRLMRGPNLVAGTDHGNFTLDWPDSHVYATYGGAADDWSAGLVVSQVNAGSFGVALRATNPTTTMSPAVANPLVDHMELTVHFTCP